MNKKKESTKKLIGDNGVIEKNDYVGKVTTLICIVVSFVLIVLGTLAFTGV